MPEIRILRLALCSCTLVLAAFLGATADAGAAYRSSIPANGTTVATAPVQVFITFAGATSATRSSGSVTDVRGAVVSTGWSVDPSDHTTMTVALKPGLGSGVYTVQYASVAEDDGQVTNGSFIFTVAPGATTSVRSGGRAAPWGLVLAVAIAVMAFIACGLVIVLRSRREYLAMMAREASRKRDEEAEKNESDPSSPH